jgi:hypothetical protein
LVIPTGLAEALIGLPSASIVTAAGETIAPDGQGLKTHLSEAEKRPQPSGWKP